MRKVTALIYFILCSNFTDAQTILTESKDTLIVGSEKYLSEVVKIYHKYNYIIDSLTQKTPPASSGRNYAGNNKEAYYIDRQLNEYEVLIKQFLPITKVKAVYYFHSGKNMKPYYEVSFVGNDKDLKSGKIRWYIK